VGEKKKGKDKEKKRVCDVNSMCKCALGKCPPSLNWERERVWVAPAKLAPHYTLMMSALLMVLHTGFSILHTMDEWMNDRIW
jgi:hypothetical protein